MIGQKRLLEKFNSFSNIPFATLIIGPHGSGKKTLVDTIVENINIDVFNVDTTFTDGTKIALYTCPNDMLVVFDLTKSMSVTTAINLQNSALKFIEELPHNIKAIILADSVERTLPTIINRCYVYHMDNYTQEELLEIARKNNKSLEGYTDAELRYLRWPLNIKNAPEISVLKEMENLVDTIFTSIGKANISNTLSISKKINFNGEIGLYDLDLFLNIFDVKLAEKVLHENDKKYIETFTLFNFMVYNIYGYNYNKRYIFEEFLLDIKQILT